jgi:hypothetical protein
LEVAAEPILSEERTGSCESSAQEALISKMLRYAISFTRFLIIVR